MTNSGRDDGSEKLGDRLSERRSSAAKDWDISEFSCDHCSAAKTCEYAFDPYNTNGDCLAEK
jgi:hypothetical protein